MSRPERQQNVLDLLKGLRGIEPLKQLFWSELNYQRVNQPLSRRGWTESASKALADDPVLFAGGGEDNAFHVIYCRLASDALSRGFERPVVTQLLREHPYALFVFSNKGQTDWHFLNVKYDDQAERRRLFRRITVRPGAGLRTATERVQILDLAEINPELFGITPLAIQQRCDAAFDVEAVTKDFFREIANWYFWALKNVHFPKDAPKEADGHDHISVIRLITRLIFCWFVKEKGLIPDTLFDERILAKTLTGFEPTKTSDKESVFYKAILQNLFFATLNTEMDKRDWTKEEQNFMAHSLYRFRESFQKPNEALALFKNIPFLNGGLFECLDKPIGSKEKPEYIRIDGFSRREDSQPIVPDFLFFGGEREVDLSADFGDTKFRRVQVRGLIHIFNRYNFTVEENTPIEQEVALDPELSGKVFENLLAAYNPETGATARKQTGSFFTPREIVNYMVDEALIAYLKIKLEAALPTAKDVEARLRHLFAYNDEPHQFTPQEAEAYPKRTDTKRIAGETAGNIRSAIELMDQTDAAQAVVTTLVRMVEEKRLKVKIYTKGRLHAKAYIFDYGKVFDKSGKPMERHENGLAIIGSSNLTLSGVTHNTELNVLVQGNDNHAELGKWFDGLWDESQDFDEALMQEMKQSWAVASVRPYDVYMKALYTLVRDRLEDEDDKDLLYDDEITKRLADFQKVAVRQARQMIRDYGGAFVADVVGLGKSYIGAAIVKHFERTDHARALILCPAALTDMRVMACTTMSRRRSSAANLMPACTALAQRCAA